MRRFTLIISLILSISVLLLSSCKPTEPTIVEESGGVSETGSDLGLSETTSGESSSSLDENVSGESTESTISETGASDSSSLTQSVASSTSILTTSLDNIPDTEEDKWGTDPGLASVKKVPAWMKSISNGNLVSLSASKLNEETYSYRKTVFKALTGKALNIDERIVEWNSLRTTLQTMVLANDAPDIFSIYNGVGIYLRNKGLTEDINDYINMNDAAWKDMKKYSEVMFYKGELTGVSISDPLITGGIMYNKTLINQAGLDDPWDVYQNGDWDITTFLDYVEELTLDNDHDGVPEVYGVSMAPESIFRMALSSGEDLVKVNNDGSITNNLRSATFTRWASYARDITDIGSYDTESWTRNQRFVQGKVAMSHCNIWEQTATAALIAMKKAGTLGWVPSPKDVGASKYLHCAEITYSFIPKNAANPKGAAAYYYTLRYMGLNPSAEQENIVKNKFLNEYGWTLAEYEFQKNISKNLTPVTFNWAHIPDFSYTSLWNVFTEDWSTLVEKVYPSLQSALSAQNK